MSSKKQRHQVTPAVYLVLRRADGNILFIRRYNTGYMDGWYGLPSGHLEGNEPADMAAAREAKEEVGITIRQQDLRLVHLTHRVAEEGSHERLDLTFETTMWQGEPVNAEPHKCDELLWADPSNPPAKTIPVIKQILEKAAKSVPYSNYNFE